jgi:hypothetical protein
MNRRIVFKVYRWRATLFQACLTAAALQAIRPPVAFAVDTLVYSFEIDEEGFAPNGGAFPVVRDTIGATDGSSSLRVNVPSGATFVGALTSSLHPAIGNPGELGAGIDHVTFDLTITQPFGPPPPTPVGFAVVGITIFAQKGGVFGIPVQFRHEFHIDGLAAGTHPVKIDLLDAHPYAPDFLNDNFSFNEVFGGLDDLTPTGFQFFFNKTGSANNHPLTVYIDNVRVGLTPASVPGDYNGNGTVDAADYVLWRDGGPLQNEVADPGTVSAADYDAWRARFGNPSAGGVGSFAAVPEPAAAVALIIAGACVLATRRGLAVR